MLMSSGPKKKNPSHFSNIRNGRKLILRELAMALARLNVLARKTCNSGHHIHVSAATDVFLGHISEITLTHSVQDSPG